MSDNKKQILINIPENLKVELEKMAKETGLSQTQLVLLSVQSLIANYDEKGSFIFADLLNPEHRKR